MTFESNIISPCKLLKQFPLEESESEFLCRSRKLAKNIVQGNLQKTVIIVGPCSIHSIESALIFAKKLKKLESYVKETLFLVMRVYIEKPRTTTGWKGFLYDPYLNGTNDLEAGISLVRSLFLKLAELRLPAATEFVNPFAAPYFQDLVTWGFIGARTASSQIHRELASSLSFPVGFKNTTDGNISLPLNSIIAARCPHNFLGVNSRGNLASISSPGNSFCHLVLRGSEIDTNYEKESLYFANKLQNNAGIFSKIMVDCAHGNSKKNHLLQKKTFLKVIDQYIENSTPLLGIMMESFLDSGNQSFDQGRIPSSTLSITDPCLSWEETEDLILTLHNKLCVNMQTQPA